MTTLYIVESWITAPVMAGGLIVLPAVRLSGRDALQTYDSKSELIADLRSGELYPSGVSKIWEVAFDVKPQDVTELIAAEVMQLLQQEQERPSWDMLGWLQEQGAASVGMMAAE